MLNKSKLHLLFVIHPVYYYEGQGQQRRRYSFLQKHVGA